MMFSGGRYGLYFGVLGRDAAEVAADRMVRLIPSVSLPSSGEMGLFLASWARIAGRFTSGLCLIRLLVSHPFQVLTVAQEVVASQPWRCLDMCMLPQIDGTSVGSRGWTGAVKPALPLLSNLSSCMCTQAAMIGMRRQMAVSVRACGVCGGELGDFGAHISNPVVNAGEVAAGRGAAGEGGLWREKTVQLACKHVFHDLCIRGWAIVGKKVLS